MEKVICINISRGCLLSQIYKQQYFVFVNLEKGTGSRQVFGRKYVNETWIPLKACYRI